MFLATQTFGDGPSLVFIHGWGASSDLWRPWIAQYFTDYQVTLVDLPGHGSSPSLFCSENDSIPNVWMEALLAVLPERAILVGWSLGGLMAQSLAVHYPERLRGLVLLASSPCFVQKAGWLPGLDSVLLSRYLAEVMPQTAGLLKSFVSLQALGSPQPRQLVKQLLPLITERLIHHAASLRQGLLLLESVDLRVALAQIRVPTLWLLADRDAIVPSGLIDTLPLLQPQAQCVRLADSGHVPFLVQAQVTAHEIRTFLQGFSHD